MTKKMVTVLFTFLVVMFSVGGHCGKENVVTGPMATPVPGMPTPTPPPASHMAMVNIGQGGLAFVDQTSGSSTTTLHVGDTVQWTWVAGLPHSTTSGSCPGGNCQPSGLWDSGINGAGHTFSQTFRQSGTFPYYCAVHLSAMQGTVVVQ